MTLLNRSTDPEKETLLLISGVGVNAGRIEIVKEVSFSAVAGEVLAIIGPSGSGKTTLMRAMTGESAYRGSIELAGRQVRELGPGAQADLRGVLPQNSQISFPLNVTEVVSLGFLGHRPERVDRGPRVKEALAKVGLNGFEGRIYQDLSGGEQQRVQLARVLVQVWDPVPMDGPAHWLFLDEPVSSLDIKHQYQIMQLARDYADSGGGVVTVMHDLNLTLAFADKVLVMKDGYGLAFGRREEVMTAELLSTAYDFPLKMTANENGEDPLVTPERFRSRP
ncbi:heme ABC transporter ATP-binding protein [uncultured Roseibium sp.]|uniref:heme ABC transporter ATP-binding protein n=1 Tax=uncultured Roseibium sp. TaxID=1936171 RepID=UPI00260DE0AC|nr:heme ABC transporter ATP-binding protein [uncultured Roseibium sp.]